MAGYEGCGDRHPVPWRPVDPGMQEHGPAVIQAPSRCVGQQVFQRPWWSVLPLVLYVASTSPIARPPSTNRLQCALPLIASGIRRYACCGNGWPRLPRGGWTLRMSRSVVELGHPAALAPRRSPVQPFIPFAPPRPPPPPPPPPRTPRAPSSELLPTAVRCTLLVLPQSARSLSLVHAL